MRVVLVSHTYTEPGYWEDLDELGRRLELLVLTPDSWHTDMLHPMKRVPVQTGRPWRHHPLAAAWAGYEYRYVFNPVQLVKVVRGFQPDLVHIEQEPESLVFLQLSFLKPVCRFRLMFSTWENVKPLSLGRWQRRINYRFADAALAGNQAAMVRTRLLGFPKRMAVVPVFGFASSYAEGSVKAAPARNGHTFVVGFAGRLVPEKGLDTLLAAVRALPRAELLVAGDGPLACTLAQEPGVRLLGAVPRSEMGKFWKEIDVLVLPSRTHTQNVEQFGRVLAEAMTVRVPVIGSSAGAIPEVIGDAGMVFPEGDEKTLAASLKKLRDNPRFAVELMEKGSRRVANLYSHVAIATRLERFYQDVLAA